MPTSASGRMRAIRLERYGSPDALRLEDVQKVAPGDGQVLIRVLSASANPRDWRRVRADPFIVRLSEGLFRPRHAGLGSDVAGRVEAVGRGVERFRVGDEVFGDVGAGGFADFVCAGEEQVVRKPDNVSFEEASAVPVAAVTALQGLRDLGRLRTGQTVLINGASGGVGTHAVQLAKVLGAEVTGVCSTRNLELVESIGADHVIDYTRSDFTRLGRRYDLVFDAIGNCTAAGYGRALAPEGRAVVAGFTTASRMIVQVVLLGSIVSASGKKTVRPLLATATRADLAFVAELLAQGEIKPVIDRRYPLADVPTALAYLETGRARGKVVIRVADA